MRGGSSRWAPATRGPRAGSDAAGGWFRSALGMSRDLFHGLFIYARQSLGTEHSKRRRIGMNTKRNSDRPRIRTAVAAAVATAGIAVALTGGAASQARSGTAAQIPPPRPLPAPHEFAGKIDNPYFPLKPGTAFHYRGSEDGDRL